MHSDNQALRPVEAGNDRAIIHPQVQLVGHHRWRPDREIFKVLRLCGRGASCCVGCLLAACILGTTVELSTAERGPPSGNAPHLRSPHNRGRLCTPPLRQYYLPNATAGCSFDARVLCALCSMLCTKPHVPRPYLRPRRCTRAACAPTHYLLPWSGIMHSALPTSRSAPGPGQHGAQLRSPFRPSYLC